MTTIFDQYAQKGNRFLNELAAELGTDDKEQAVRVTRALFRTLREVLTLNESFQLLPQLPMALKALYVEGWDINSSKKIKSEKDFLTNMAKEEGPSVWKDFSQAADMRKVVIAAFKILRNYITEGEFDDIEAVLPHGIKQLVRDSKK